MKKIAICNMKGGVGKSSTTVALSEAFAEREKGPILVIDADTQASSSFALVGDKNLARMMNEQKTLDDFLRDRFFNGGRKPIIHYIHGQASAITKTGKGNKNLDVSLLPSSFRLRITEREIIYELAKKFGLAGIEEQLTRLLEDELRNISGKYSYCFLDCAPGQSPITTAMLAIADLIVAPVIPDPISVMGLDAFINQITGVMGPQAAGRKPYVLFTRSMAEAKSGGLAKLWNPDTSKMTKISSHRENEAKIRGLAKAEPDKFGLFAATLPESPIMAHAMGLSGQKNSPTFLQKYGDYRENLFRLSKEIEEILR